MEVGLQPEVLGTMYTWKGKIKKGVAVGGRKKKRERTQDAGKLEADSMMMMTACRSWNDAEEAGAEEEDDDDEERIKRDMDIFLFAA